MRKINNIFKSIIKLFKRNSDQKVTVQFRELTEDQVPAEIRDLIEKKEKEMKEKEAQM